MNVLVIGGAGYVGTPLCHWLEMLGHRVSVLDTFWFGDGLRPTVQRFRGDVRDREAVAGALRDQDVVIHLACISNDPSAELKPALTREVNLESFGPVLEEIRRAQIRRLIFASSSSVYGIQSGEVTEGRRCKPLTDYSKFKLECEALLRAADLGECAWTILRPATVCGWSPRMRFDLVVNAMTRAALANHRIPVHGGTQLRPNVHINDMVRAYADVLSAHGDKVRGKTFNVGAVNMSLLEIADNVRRAVNLGRVELAHEPSTDLRSYHIDSTLIQETIEWKPYYTPREAAEEIAGRTHWGAGFNFEESRFYNVRRMKELFP